MFAFMIPECIVLSSIASVMMWSIAAAVALVTLVALCLRGKNQYILYIHFLLHSQLCDFECTLSPCQVQIFSYQDLHNLLEHEKVIQDNQLQNYVEIFLFCVYCSILQLKQDPPAILQKRNAKDNFLLNHRLDLEYLKISNQLKNCTTKLISFNSDMTTSLLWVGFLQKQPTYVNLQCRENMTDFYTAEVHLCNIFWKIIGFSCLFSS